MEINFDASPTLRLLNAGKKDHTAQEILHAMNFHNDREIRGAMDDISRNAGAEPLASGDKTGTEIGAPSPPLAIQARQIPNNEHLIYTRTITRKQA
jgi:hypothetical protein